MTRRARPFSFGALLLFALSGTCLGQTFSLTGYVVDAATGKPMPGTRVHLFGGPEQPYWFPRPGRVRPAAVAGPEGQFVFAGLAAKQYSLQAELPNELAIYAGPEYPIDLIASHLYGLPGRRIEVGPGLEGRPVIFRISPQAILAGAVRDKYGDPLGRLRVTLYHWERRGARISLIPVARSYSDNRGEYTFGGLAPGNYVVCAEAGLSPSAEGEVQYRQGNYSRVYERACAPRPELPGARFLVAASGRPRLDLTLSSMPSFPLRVTGLVWPGGELLSSGRQFPGYGLDYMDATGESIILQDTVNLPGHGVEIGHVAPGRYAVIARIFDKEGPGAAARREIEVGETQPPLITLEPVPGATVSFDVRDESGNTLHGGRADISFLPTTVGLRVRRLEKSPSFVLDAGSYWLSIGARQPYCAVSARVDGSGDALHERLVFAPGTSSHLDVQLSRQCGAIDLRTVSEEGSLPFSDFLLLLNGSPQDPGGAILGSSDATGKATIGPVAPGRYLLWAWTSNGDGYVGPELSGMANVAREVIVTAGATTSLTIKPMRGGGAR